MRPLFNTLLTTSQAYGTFSSYYLQRPLYGKDVLLLNLIGSTQCFIILGLSGVVGRLVDADYTERLLWIGTAFVTAGQFALSACVGNGSQGDGSYGLIWLTQGLLTSLGMACFFVSSSQGTEFILSPHVFGVSNNRQLSQLGSRRKRDSPSALSRRAPASQA